MEVVSKERGTFKIVLSWGDTQKNPTLYALSASSPKNCMIGSFKSEKFGREEGDSLQQGNITW